MREYIMSEPRLEDIKDYENLDTERKRAFIAIVFAALLMGIVYTVVGSFFDNSQEEIQVQETLKIIPMK